MRFNLEMIEIKIPETKKKEIVVFIRSDMCRKQN